MARVTVLNAKDFPPEIRDIVKNGGSHSADGVWATRPDLMLSYRNFSHQLSTHSLLSKKLVELVRLRIAFHNQCRSCMARRSEAAMQDGLTEDLVCQLASPAEGPDLSEADRAALHYADLMATDHLQISDATFERLRGYFSEPQIIEIGIHCAIFVGFGRLAMSWDLVDELPERFKDRTSTITPWENAVA